MKTSLIAVLTMVLRPGTAVRFQIAVERGHAGSLIAVGAIVNRALEGGARVAAAVRKDAELHAAR